MSSNNFIAAAALVSLLLLPATGKAQNEREDYGAWKKRQQESYGNYKRQQQDDYANFRRKANEEYAEFVRRHWGELTALKGIEPPHHEPVPPVIVPEEDKDKKCEDDENTFEDVVVVEPPSPQPQPIEPVTPIDPILQNPLTVSTIFFGTRMECEISSIPAFELADLGNDAIGDAWKSISNGQCDRLLEQCLEMRETYRLNDWGYIQLLDSLTQRIMLPTGHIRSLDEATLLMAWLYCQSGYKMRLARAKGRLYMLFASENIIYNVNYFSIGGDRYYPYKGEKLETMYVCDVSFPQEQSMTLKIVSEPRLTNKSSGSRTLQSKRYPHIKVTTTVNHNLIDFYNNYPTGSITDDFGTRWAMYANAPLSEKAKQTLYPQLNSLLAGKSKLDAAEELLNWVQTSLVYEYDDTIWGYDRAFFAEETLFYPYADCEDRSILFANLVRDLLGLDVVLLYYPGHLATAVRFEGKQPKGDYLEISNGRYYVADPTYIGAPIGLTMPDLKGESIKVIILQ